MSELKLNNFSFAHKIELYSFVDETGVLWMQAKPLATALGFSKQREAVVKYVSECNKRVHERLPGVVSIPSTFHPLTKFINESGLYQLFTHSSMLNAIEFQTWVVNDVLPSLRGPNEQQASPPPHLQMNRLDRMIERFEQQDRRLEERDQLIARQSKAIIDMIPYVAQDGPSHAPMCGSHLCTDV